MRVDLSELINYSSRLFVLSALLNADILLFWSDKLEFLKFALVFDLLFEVVTDTIVVLIRIFPVLSIHLEGEKYDILVLQLHLLL